MDMGTVAVINPFAATGLMLGGSLASVFFGRTKMYARYLGKTATDERGVVWYKIRWDGRDAWVSSMYTRKISY